MDGLLSGAPVTLQFLAVPDPSAPLLEQVAAGWPLNPFQTPAYAAARSLAGHRPVVVGLWAGTEPKAASLAFLRGPRLARALEIPSTIPAPEPERFWAGLWRWASREGAWQLDLGSFGSEPAPLPALPRPLSRRERVEFVLDLTQPDPLRDASSNHRRNIGRGRKAGLAIRRSRDPALCPAHVALMDQSMERREHRGESVPRGSDPAPLRHLLESGAAELFQAVKGEEVVSSILVLKARLGGYYHSAGTSPEGMECGASPFLIGEVAGALKSEGMSQFNLAGAGPESPGLQRFKAGFGAKEVRLEAGSFSVASRPGRLLRRAALFLGRRAGVIR